MKFLVIVKIAMRNCLRNRRRALLAATIVALGVLGFSLLEGYFTNVYRVLEDQAVVGERLGHLVITKEGFYKHGAQDPSKYAFGEEEVQKVRKTLSDIPEITVVSQRLTVSGLITNGDASRVFFGEAMEAADLDALRGKKYADLPGKLDSADAYCGVFGSRLAEYLGISQGGEATVLSSTFGGMVNAMDIKACQVANTGSSATNDKFVLMSLPFARKFLAFEGADKISVKLTDDGSVAAVRPKVAAAMAGLGLKTEIKGWREVSQYFNQVKGMFDMMNGFFAIVLTLVVIAIVTNTLAMAIAERIREIGTMRAFGMLPAWINRMFLVEGALVTGLGAALGSVAAAGVGAIINSAHITYTPPDATAEAVLALDILPENLFGTMFTLVLIGAFSAYFIARRASKMNVVEALGHV